MRSTRVMTALATALLAVLLLSCGFRRAMNQAVQQAAQQAQRQNDLMQIGMAYHNYVNTNNKAPTRAEDLIPLLVGDQNAIGMLQDGSLVFIYGVSVKDMMAQAGSGNTVLAYESKVPGMGGLVLMGDGTVQTVMPAVFQGMTQAKPAPRDVKKDDTKPVLPKDEKKDDKPKRDSRKF